MTYFLTAGATLEGGTARICYTFTPTSVDVYNRPTTAHKLLYTFTVHLEVTYANRIKNQEANETYE